MNLVLPVIDTLLVHFQSIHNYSAIQVGYREILCISDV